MMKFAVYMIVFIFFSCCKTMNNYDINIGPSESIKSELIDLKKYIEIQWDNTYNFRHDRIHLPPNYTTMVWKSEFGDLIYGNKTDTVLIKYLIYRDMLDSLILDHDDEIHFTDIQKFYGQPSLVSTKENGMTTNYNYLFNNTKYPNCSCNSGVNNYLGANCSLLDFQFNKSGNLIKVHKSMFNP